MGFQHALMNSLKVATTLSSKFYAQDQIYALPVNSEVTEVITPIFSN